MADEIIQVPPIPLPRKFVDNGDGSYSEQMGGSFTSISKASATGTQTSVALTGADQLALASNANRLGFTIENDSSTTVYLLAASGTASATVKSFSLLPGDIYESLVRYTGAVRCLSVAVTGSLRVVEYT